MRRENTDDASVAEVQEITGLHTTILVLVQCFKTKLHKTMAQSGYSLK